MSAAAADHRWWQPLPQCLLPLYVGIGNLLVNWVRQIIFSFIVIFYKYPYVINLCGKLYYYYSH